MMAPVLYAPSRLEARALRRGTTTPVWRTGTGRRRAQRTASAAAACHLDGALVVGVGGGLDPRLDTGDVVVADRLLTRDGRGTLQVLPVAGILAGQLRRLGLSVRSGPVVTTDHVVTGREREELSARGALAVDMESAWLLRRRAVSDQEESAQDCAQAAQPCAAQAAAGVVRVVADVADSPLLRPATLRRLRTACRTLSVLGPALTAWAGAVGPRFLLLAGPEDTVLPLGPDGHKVDDRTPGERPAGTALVQREDDAATDRRQGQTMASWADLVVVVGFVGSSDSRRLVGSARRTGARAYVVGNAGELDLRWLHGVRRVGLTAEPAAPPARVKEAVAALAALGPTAVSTHLSIAENVGVALPKEVRTA